MRSKARLTLAVMLVALSIGTVWAGLNTGTFMADEDPLAPADAIFVLGGTRVQRPSEAAELYREGYAPMIVLSRELPEDGAAELAQRGIVIPGSAEVSRELLLKLGVPGDRIILTDPFHANTAAEAQTLRGLAQRFGWKRVIVVTSKYHLRRAMMAMRRATGDTVEVIGRGSRFDRSTPEAWWRRRSDIREIVGEIPRLLAYWVGAGG